MRVVPRDVRQPDVAMHDAAAVKHLEREANIAHEAKDHLLKGAWTHRVGGGMCGQRQAGKRERQAKRGAQRRERETNKIRTSFKR